MAIPTQMLSDEEMGLARTLAATDVDDIYVWETLRQTAGRTALDRLADTAAHVKRIAVVALAMREAR